MNASRFSRLTYITTISYTRTVVQEWCKDDDQSQWEKPKFDPLPLLNTKIYLRDYVVDTYHPAKFHPDRIRGFVSAHARFRSSNCLLSYVFVFWVLQIVYSQDARTDFDAKYVWRGSARGSLLEVAKPKVKLYTPFAPKTAILGPLSTGLENVRSKTPLTLDMY